MHHSDGSGIQTMRKQTQKKSHQSKFTSLLSVPVIFTTSPRETGQPWGGLGRRANVQTLIDENKTPPSDKHSHTRALSYTHACTYRLLPALSALHQREELHLFLSQFFIIEGAKETQHFLFTSSAAFSLTLSFSFLRL